MKTDRDIKIMGLFYITFSLLSTTQKDTSGFFMKYIVVLICSVSFTIVQKKACSNRSS